MNKAEATIVETQNKDKPEKPVKRNRDEKLRKKDDKSVDHVLKALNSLETAEEKLAAMCQKYAEMFNDHRILQNAAKVAEKKNNILQKEKEQLQADHSKAILTRSRLESLCRELQRQNKAVKEECMVKIREEEEKKRAVAAKLQSTLTELGTLLAQNNDKNAKLRDDNLDMTAKLKNVCDQYEKKEQHVEKMAKQMHLEMQLANTKLAKAKMEMALEKEALLRDNQQLLLELKEYKTQLEEMKTSEIALRSQIQMYNDKYDEFHKALLQSNDAIGSFKQEMERMAKQIRKLEKETVAWKHRYETTHRTLLQMTEEKIKSDETACVSERRLTALQGLCRSLQAQCNHLREVVKSQTGSSGDAVAVETSQESNVGIQLNSELSGMEVPVVNNTSVADNKTADVSEVTVNGGGDAQNIQPLVDNALEETNESTTTVDVVEEIVTATSDKPGDNHMDQTSVKDETLELSDAVKVTNGYLPPEENNISTDISKIEQSPKITEEINSDIKPESISLTENLTNCNSIVEEVTETSGGQNSSSAGVPINQKEVTQKVASEVAGPPANNIQTQSKKNRNKRKKNGGALVKS